jgi:hypothetical protein
MSPWFVAAYTSWTTGFEATPSGSDSVSQGDDRIRELKENTRNRLNMEHWWDTSTNNQGHHREGSANLWYRAPCPTADLTANPDGTASTFGTPDVGKACINSTDQSMAVWNGSAYTAAIGALFGNSWGHYAAGVAPVDTYDPTKFAIRNVITDTTTDPVACAGGAAFSHTAIASQTFGDAGAACFTTGSMDFSSRVPTTSRGLVIGQLRIHYTAGSGGCTGTVGIYRDAMGNQVGQLQIGDISAGGANDIQVTTVAYVTGITAAAHEFALHASDSVNNDCTFTADPNGGNLTYIDLGPEYP